MNKKERIDWLRCRIEECENYIYHHAKSDFDAYGDRLLLNHYQKCLNELVPLPYRAPQPIAKGGQ